ncbi:MAG: glycosyltransferase [Candidatus Hodarchaeota archaeon]
MKNLKINIIFEFHEGPWGGGNQFLNALKKNLEKRGLYETDPTKANCFIFNSHHYINKVLKIKMNNQGKIFIHRIDGPTYLTKKAQPKLDHLIYDLNRYIADGTIFQSFWSKRENYSYGLSNTSYTKVINNAPDNNIFFPLENKMIKNWKNKKCNIITSSWSTNMDKGFKLYQYLDNHLNFNEYSMIFVGNSPISFKNIKHISPVNSHEMANLLRESDIYVTGALHEACSNSLLEALNCGLPCIAINNASNLEILKDRGEVFETFEECLEKIQIVKNNYEKYRKKIVISDFEETSNRYYSFVNYIYSLQSSSRIINKKLRLFDYYKIIIKSLFLHILTINFLFYEFLRIISDLKVKISSIPKK